jgi:transmembrane sensor
MVQLDRPLIDQALAWRHGTVVLNDATLTEAAAEMNRYSAVLITIDGDELGRLRVGGSYPIGDNAGFAPALAHLFGLVVRSHGDRIELRSK